MIAILPLLLALQAPCDVLLVDSLGDQVARLAELDGVPGSTSVHEVTALWRSETPLTPRALDVRTTGGAATAYWADSTRDRLYRGSDLNGNGSLEPFETDVYRDSGKLDGASRPLGLVVTDDGALVWCSDRGREGLFRCRDQDGDGLALAPAELEVLVDGASGGHPVETDTGTVLVGGDALVALAREGNAVVAYLTGGEEALVRFEDANGDGDVLDPGESRLFLNASGKNPGLPQNVDWAAGDLRSLVVSGSFGATFYGRLRHVTVGREGGRSVWYFGCDSHAASIFGLNQQFQGIAGLVFRGEDLNGDGDLQDAGEVRLFFDGSVTSYAVLPIDQVLALDACGGELHLAYLQGTEKRVTRLVDRNFDGDAHDGGELTPPRFDTYSFGLAAPFSAGAPLVQDLVAVAPGTFAEPNALFERSGSGCTLTATGGIPSLHGLGRARLGTRGFTCELRGALGGSAAFLYLSDAFGAWRGFPLPYELTDFGLPGCLLYVRNQAVYPALTSGLPGLPPSPVSASPASGYASVTFDVPQDLSLVDREFRLQWFVLDLVAIPTASLPGVAATGRGTIVVEL